MGEGGVKEFVKNGPTSFMDGPFHNITGAPGGWPRVIDGVFESFFFFSFLQRSSATIHPRSRMALSKWLTSRIITSTVPRPLTIVTRASFFGVCHIVHWRPKCLGWQAILLNKMTPGEVAMWLPWWYHDLAFPAPGNWGLFVNLIIFSQWKNDQFQQNFRSKLKV